MNYKRKTVDRWKFDAQSIVIGTLSITLMFSMYQNNQLSGKAGQLTQQVQAARGKEASVAATVSGFSHLIKEVKVDREVTPITLRVSHYWPSLGGVNCAVFVDGECVSKMANGQPWQDHVEKAIACPRELPFGTKIEVLGETWECMDRGGAIKKIGDTYWIDMLTPNARVPYGQIVEGKIIN